MLKCPKEAQKGGSRLRIVGDALEAGNWCWSVQDLDLRHTNKAVHKRGSWPASNSRPKADFCDRNLQRILNDFDCGFQHSSAFVVFFQARKCELNSKRPRTDVGAQGGHRNLQGLNLP